MYHPHRLFSDNITPLDIIFVHVYFSWCRRYWSYTCLSLDVRSWPGARPSDETSQRSGIERCRISCETGCCRQLANDLPASANSLKALYIICLRTRKLLNTINREFKDVVFEYVVFDSNRFDTGVTLQNNIYIYIYIYI